MENRYTNGEMKSNVTLYDKQEVMFISIIKVVMIFDALLMLTRPKIQGDSMRISLLFFTTLQAP